MKTLLTATVLLSGAVLALAYNPAEHACTTINIPDIPGYLTLKCDFHMHTVFSDGLVWPSVRVDEAWCEGLDGIAITDHIERHPHKAEGLTTDPNRSYEIARAAGQELDLLVVKGSEITRAMPPGHLNALFLTNATPLETANWEDAVKNARAQGAFIVWNHPGWERQITNGLVLWYPEHTWLREQDMLHGIEVINGRDYYPEAHRWAVERRLTLLGNTDIHPPLGMEHDTRRGDHRPMTLVFAKARTVEALREALFERRTAIYHGNQLIGDEQFLRPIYEKSIQWGKTTLVLRGRQRVWVRIGNSSDISYELERVSELKELETPRKLILPARKTALFEVRGTKAAEGRRKLAAAYRVTNLLVGPDKPVEISIPLDITFAASE
ncbi:MAG TPA: Sb-PDE family phosphodiesterase [Candidatus Paceibacterota bacterium]|nr:Sb-PDE family phosphodiesterase [Verrucomicrobiota bacterium]HSA12963.1 Sb-PDE family phosphodiesterase [Candidatus Paceibacterota bacterium]